MDVRVAQLLLLIPYLATGFQENHDLSSVSQHPVMNVLDVAADGTSSRGHVTDYFTYKPFTTLVRIQIEQCGKNSGKLCQKKAVVGYRHLRSGRCILQQVDKETLHNLNSTRVYKFKDYTFNTVQRRISLGKKLDQFCEGLDIALLEAMTFNNDENLLQARAKRQVRSRFRGQTQTQFMNFGNGNGSAEAVSKPDVSTAVVRGSNGMGSAQSQSGGRDCADECFGPSASSRPRIDAGYPAGQQGPSGGFPGSQQRPGYPGGPQGPGVGGPGGQQVPVGGYPGAPHGPAVGFPGAGEPGRHQVPVGGYPGGPGGQQIPVGGYPGGPGGQQIPVGGYPGGPGGQQIPVGGYPGRPHGPAISYPGVGGPEGHQVTVGGYPGGPSGQQKPVGGYPGGPHGPAISYPGVGGPGGHQVPVGGYPGGPSGHQVPVGGYPGGPGRQQIPFGGYPGGPGGQQIPVGGYPGGPGGQQIPVGGHPVGPHGPAISYPGVGGPGGQQVPVGGYPGGPHGPAISHPGVGGPGGHQVPAGGHPGAPHGPAVGYPGVGGPGGQQVPAGGHPDHGYPSGHSPVQGPGHPSNIYGPGYGPGQGYPNPIHGPGGQIQPGFPNIHVVPVHPSGQGGVVIQSPHPGSPAHTPGSATTQPAGPVATDGPHKTTHPAIFPPSSISRLYPPLPEGQHIPISPQPGPGIPPHTGSYPPSSSAKLPGGPQVPAGQFPTPHLPAPGPGAQGPEYKPPYPDSLPPSSMSKLPGGPQGPSVTYPGGFHPSASSKVPGYPRVAGPSLPGGPSNFYPGPHSGYPSHSPSGHGPIYPAGGPGQGQPHTGTVGGPGYPSRHGPYPGGVGGPGQPQPGTVEGPGHPSGHGPYPAGVGGPGQPQPGTVGGPGYPSGHGPYPAGVGQPHTGTVGGPGYPSGHGPYPAGVGGPGQLQPGTVGGPGYPSGHGPYPAGVGGPGQLQPGTVGGPGYPSGHGPYPGGVVGPLPGTIGGPGPVYVPHPSGPLPSQARPGDPYGPQHPGVVGGPGYVPSHTYPGHVVPVQPGSGSGYPGITHHLPGTLGYPGVVGGPVGGPGSIPGGPQPQPGTIYSPNLPGGQAPGYPGPGQYPEGPGTQLVPGSQQGYPAGQPCPPGVPCDPAKACIPGYPCDDTEDSQVQTSVFQEGNDTKALSSAQGRFGSGIAQAQVSGLYSGSGSFSAQAQTSDSNKGAQVQVIGGNRGALSSAQGMGGRGQTQAQVQLGSQTGATIAEAQSGGLHFGTNTQVQAGMQGGLADAQADGPGSTSSQAQIGFTPYQQKTLVQKEQRAPFEGGVSATAQSGKYSGQSQTELFGSFYEGIRYTGSAQASSSKSKTNSSSTDRQNVSHMGAIAGLPPLPAFGEGILKNKTVLNDSEVGFHDPSLEKKEDAPKASPNPRVNKDAEIVETKGNEELFEEVDVAQLRTKPIRLEAGKGINTEHGIVIDADEGLTVDQKGPTQSQTVFLSGLDKDKHDIHIEQGSNGVIREGDLLEPGESVVDGYQIPAGYRGRVTSVTGDVTRRISPGHAQTQSVVVRPGSGNILYSNIRPAQQISSPGSDFVSVTKSETGQINNRATGKKFSHTYYTKSSTCGYFTFTCNVVFGSNGRAKICKPNPPTNADGSPCTP